MEDDYNGPTAQEETGKAEGSFYNIDDEEALCQYLEELAAALETSEKSTAEQMRK